MDDNKIQIQLSRLAQRYNLTNLNQEEKEFILTDKEVDAVKKRFIEEQQEFKRWKLKNRGAKEETILLKISKVNWNKLNFKPAIDEANNNKHHGIESAKFKEEEDAKKEQAEIEKRNAYNAKYMYQGMRISSKNYYGKTLIVNDYNKHLITVLCYFCSGDEKFETELGYNFNKGLWIRGKMGIGKTHLVKCIAENPYKPILITSMIEINEHLLDHGFYNFDVADKDYKKVYIDDVGTEEPLVIHYGTRHTFFKTFIEKKYLNCKKFDDLIISTNLDFNGVEKIYGSRVRSRIKDMFNIIDVEGNDMRGN